MESREEISQSVKSELEKQLDINFETLNKELKIAYELLEPIKKQDVILVIGNAGAGKTTSINFLMGSKMTLTEDETLVVTEGEKEYGIIGTQMLSAETLYTSVTPPNNYGVRFADCAGFRGTRSKEQGIIESLSPILAIKYAQAIRGIALVISWDSFAATSNRAESLKGLARILDDFIPDAKELISPRETTMIDSVKEIWRSKRSQGGKQKIIFLITNVPCADKTVDLRFKRMFEEASKALKEGKHTEQEKKTFQAIQSITSMILANKEHVFCLRKEEMIDEMPKALKLRENVNKCLARLYESKEAIPKAMFNFNERSDSLNKVRHLVQFTLGDINFLRNDSKKLEKTENKKMTDITNCKRYKELHQSMINSLENSVEKKLKIIELEGEIEKSRRDILGIEQEIGNLGKIKKQHERELAQIDNEEPELDDAGKERPYWKDSLKIERWWFDVARVVHDNLENIGEMYERIPAGNVVGRWVMSGVSSMSKAASKYITSQCVIEKDFKYEDIPFVHADKNCESGQFVSEASLNKTGIYTVHYDSSPFEGADAEVKVYVGKKFWHPLEIQEIKTKLKNIAADIKNHDEELEKLEIIIGTRKKQIMFIREDTINEEKNQKWLTELLEKSNKEIKEIEKELNDIKKKIQQNEKSIKEYQPWIGMIESLKEVIHFEPETIKSIEEYKSSVKEKGMENSSSDYQQHLTQAQLLSQTSNVFSSPSIYEESPELLEGYDDIYSLYGSCSRD